MKPQQQQQQQGSSTADTSDGEDSYAESFCSDQQSQEACAAEPAYAQAQSPVGQQPSEPSAEQQLIREALQSAAMCLVDDSVQCAQTEVLRLTHLRHSLGRYRKPQHGSICIRPTAYSRQLQAAAEASAQSRKQACSATIVIRERTPADTAHNPYIRSRPVWSNMKMSSEEAEWRMRQRIAAAPVSQSVYESPSLVSRRSKTSSASKPKSRLKAALLAYDMQIAASHASHAEQSSNSVSGRSRSSKQKHKLAPLMHRPEVPDPH